MVWRKNESVHLLSCLMRSFDVCSAIDWNRSSKFPDRRMFRLSTLGSPRTWMTDAVSTFYRLHFFNFARFIPFSDKSNFRRSRRLRLRFFPAKGMYRFLLEISTSKLRNVARERETSYARASSEVAIVWKWTRGWATENRFYALPSPVF